MRASNQCFHQKLFYFWQCWWSRKNKKKKKNNICTLKSTKPDARKREKNQTAFLTQATNLTVWKLPVARCQTAYKPLLQHSNEESKSGIQAAWKEQFSFIRTQLCVQHFSTAQHNFSFHCGEDNEHVYFCCNRSYEDKQKGLLTWGDTRGITNSTW